MTQTLFPCPHCGAKYPFKKVLIGRNVRCTKCRNAFALQKTGIAIKVEPRGPTQPEQSDQEDQEAPATARVQADADLSLNEVKQKAQERIKKQELLKQKLSDTLSNAAMSALEAEVEKELSDEKKTKKKTQIKKERGTEIIRTNQSQLDHKRNQNFLYIVSACIGALVIGILVVLLRAETPQELAISIYAQDPPYDTKDKPESVDHYRSLMWYAQIPNKKPQVVIVDLENSSMEGEPETYYSDLSDELNKFKSLSRMYKQISWKATSKEFNQFHGIKELSQEERLQRELQKQLALQPGMEAKNPDEAAPIIQKRIVPDLWISKGQEETARSLWWNKQLKLQDEESLKNHLLKDGITVILSSELESILSKKAVNKEVATFVSRIFLGKTDNKGSFAWQDRMLDGSMPVNFTFQKFSGTRGTHMRARGAKVFKRAGLHYSGTLVKCEELDPDWRIFEFTVD